MSRLPISGAACAALLLAAQFLMAAAESAPPYALRSRLQAGAVSRVECLLEVGGELAIPADGKAESVKMSVVGNLDYHERVLANPADAGAAMQAIRYYDRAQAVLKVGEGGGGKPALRDGRRLVALECPLPDVTLFSPAGSLTREELDLIDVVGNSLVVERLLPEKPVAQGERWPHANDLMAALLRLAYVSESDAASELVSVQNAQAEIHLTGKVRGRRDGVVVEVDVKAKYRFDLDAGRITWFGLLTQEKHGAGETAPGIDCVARLQMTIAPQASCASLTDDALAGVPLTPTPERLRLAYAPSDGVWEVEHGRQWFLVNEDRDLALLRLVDGDERLGQCLIRWLPPVPEGKQMEVEAFQKEVRTALGDDFQLFVAASQEANARNYRVIRVVAQGESADVTIQWVYYLLSDRAGRQVALAFTVKADQVESFADADKAIVDALRIADL